MNRKLKSLQTETDTLKQGRDVTLAGSAEGRGGLASVLSEVTSQIHGIAAKLIRQGCGPGQLNFDRLGVRHWRKPAMLSIFSTAVCASRQEPQSLGPDPIQRELSLTGSWAWTHGAHLRL